MDDSNEKEAFEGANNTSSTENAINAFRLEDPIDMSHPEEIKALRKRMRLTQRQFAGWFGFPLDTLRHWEQGDRTPRGAALVLLNVIRDHPRVVLVAVRRARMRGVERLGKMKPPKAYRASPGWADPAWWRYGRHGMKSPAPANFPSLAPPVIPGGRETNDPPVIPGGRETSDRESSD